MRILFLDVDGVLNSERFNRTLEEQHRQLGHHEVCECFKLARQIDPEAVVRLNRLVAETGAKIVISSSWRKLFDPPELHRILGEHGLVAEIVGETPDGQDEPEMLAMYGPYDRIFRGHEIDYWLRQHPEVDRFVILDDCADMEMHRNRLVQTDCEEGLLDEHVELAIRVMSWDGKTIPSPMEELYPDDAVDLDVPLVQPPIVSTRSNTNEDARRDFDGFDIDEELRRLRLALRDGRWRVAAELAANLDEHLCRGGSLPVAWLGPSCMQGDADRTARLRDTAETAAKMTSDDRRDAAGYVAVAPEPAKQPGSSVGIHCHHNSWTHPRDKARCPEALELSRITAVQPTHDDDDYQEMFPASSEAAVLLGWRLHHSTWWCPTHVVAKNLACARCLTPCPECSCMGGPRADAVEAVEVSR